ncbi:Equilibrative nucleotide transporter 2 [Dendrobium catenatum]|uniref:Equilibrative nucleotide transporter 2 n=1 Tax=Dendrobium catenatum TaxID=906689 RepID=A0A2I0VAM9_9ASPA|nr:Equilibrative nucleotide transporter 2 [Dendrobium catenatum]
MACDSNDIEFDVFGNPNLTIFKYIKIKLDDLATSGRGGIGTFIGVCVLSAAFGIADAHVQGGMVGDLALMQPEFIQSFMAGLAASGALTSALRLITKASFEHKHDGLRKGAKFLSRSAVLRSRIISGTVMCSSLRVRLSETVYCEILSSEGCFRRVEDSFC